MVRSNGVRLLHFLARRSIASKPRNPVCLVLPISILYYVDNCLFCSKIDWWIELYRCMKLCFEVVLGDSILGQTHLQFFEITLQITVRSILSYGYFGIRRLSAWTCSFCDYCLLNLVLSCYFLMESDFRGFGSLSKEMVPVGSSKWKFRLSKANSWHWYAIF